MVYGNIFQDVGKPKNNFTSKLDIILISLKLTFFFFVSSEYLYYFFS